MNRRLLLCSWCLLAMCPAARAVQDEAPPYYIGRQACLECHAPGRDAAACSLPPIPAHGRSVELLAQPEALQIAAMSGLIESPQDSRICLECHATSSDAGPRWRARTFDLADGVQCEACHDAGSAHAAARHAHDERAANEPPARLRDLDRTVCASCHRPKPSHIAARAGGSGMAPAPGRFKTPVNLAVSPDGARLYVVAEEGDSLIVLDTVRGNVVAEIPVGRRPHDVAVSPDGETVYVTNRLSDTMSVVDAAALHVTAEVAVGDGPHGVLTDAAGEVIAVLNTAEDSISLIDARTLTGVTRLVAGRGPWSLARRADGRTMCVTSVRPHPGRFRDPPRSEVTVLEAGSTSRVVTRPIAADANMLQGIAMIPGSDIALFTMMRTKNLVPITRLAQGWTITNGLGVLWPDGRIDQVLLDEPAGAFPDPTDVAVSPDGRIAIVTSGGADQVAVVDVAALLETITSMPEPARTEVLPNHLGMSRRFVRRRLGVGSNPRGVAFSPDGRFVYVANAMDDTVTVLDAAEFTVVREISLGSPQRQSDDRLGARLFHSARITFGQQFSCRSCHPDGHVNGLTFDIEADGIGMSPVDNRTLRGIFDTAPFKWEGNNPTLQRQCGPRLAVFFTRLAPYTPAELDALVRYISSIERPPNRYRRPEGLTLTQRRGKAIFERTQTNNGEPIPRERQCRSCHSGPYRTSSAKVHVGTTMWFDEPVHTEVIDLADIDLDIEEYGELGLYYYLDVGAPTRSFDVPHLNNIYDSPPYLHNGAARTLEEIWTRFDVLSLHGATGDLTRQQLNDLIAYLKSL